MTRSKYIGAFIGVLVALGLLAVILRYGRTLHNPPPPQDVLPDIVLVTFDTVRADHLSCYGYSRKTTPRIDELAAEGVLYTRCLSTSSWTLPAHASLFTGLFPTSHGANYRYGGLKTLSELFPGMWNGYDVNALSDQVVSLATLLNRRGYATGAVVGGPWMKKPFGLSQGFDYYYDEITNPDGLLAEQVNEQALPWINKVAGRPFLLFLNYFDAHDPYWPPEGFRFRFLNASAVVDYAKATLPELVALYDAEIYYADHCLGKLIDHLKQIGRYDDTWIIVTSDHGELFGEHGMRRHGQMLWEEEVHVPLVMKYPRRWAQKGRIPTPVQLIDIMPLILDRLGLAIPDGVQGVVPGRASHPLFTELTTLASVSTLGDSRALYQDDLKFLWNSHGDHMLFNLKTDPREMKNLYATEPAKAAELRAIMDDLVAGLPKPGQTTPATRIDRRTLESLRDLGYIPGSRPASQPTTSSNPTTRK